MTGVRGVRAQKNIPSKEPLALNAVASAEPAFACVIRKLANLSALNQQAEKDAAASTFMVGTTEFNVPLANQIDVEAELEKLNKDLAYLEGFKKSVEKKLGNERFVNNAPAAVVENERNKLADATQKIESIKATIAALSK